MDDKPRKPTRRHTLEITFSADSMRELEAALNEFETKIARGEMESSGVSGGGGSSWMYRHIERPEQTPEGYREELKAWLAWDRKQKREE